MKKHIVLANAKFNNNNIISTSVHAIGGGEWSIEVRAGGEFLFELVGENGTNELFSGGQRDDLWGDLQHIESQAEEYAIKKGWYNPLPPVPVANQARRPRGKRGHGRRY